MRRTVVISAVRMFFNGVFHVLSRILCLTKKRILKATVLGKRPGFKPDSAPTAYRVL